MGLKSSYLLNAWCNNPGTLLEPHPSFVEQVQAGLSAGREEEIIAHMREVVEKPIILGEQEITELSLPLIHPTVSREEGAETAIQLQFSTEDASIVGITALIEKYNQKLHCLMHLSYKAYEVRDSNQLKQIFEGFPICVQLQEKHLVQFITVAPEIAEATIQTYPNDYLIRKGVVLSWYKELSLLYNEARKENEGDKAKSYLDTIKKATRMHWHFSAL